MFRNYDDRPFVALDLDFWNHSHGFIFKQSEDCPLHNLYTLHKGYSSGHLLNKEGIILSSSHLPTCTFFFAAAFYSQKIHDFFR